MAPRTDINYSPEAVTRRLRILRHVVSGSGHGAQLDFSRRVQIGSNTWGNYERGFPISQAQAIDLCLNYPYPISMDYILFGKEELLQQYLLERIAKATKELDEYDKAHPPTVSYIDAFARQPGRKRKSRIKARK